MSASSGDDELNLVPFIDLFSVLICFLLMTAVWMNIDTLSVDTTNATASDQPSTDPVPDKLPLAVTIFPREIHMTEGKSLTELQLVLDEKGRPSLDEFYGVLERWRASYPERKDVTLNTDDRVLYQTMISVFDSLMSRGWTEVGVNTQ